MKRKYIPLKQKLAAALTHLLPMDIRSSGKTADEIISMFDFHHEVFHVHEGADTWTNLTPMLRQDHRERTKRDLATIAKGKRIQKKEAAHKARMSHPMGLPPIKVEVPWRTWNSKRKIPSRPFPKKSRKNNF